MSTYQKNIERIAIALRHASLTIGMTDDARIRRRGFAELSTWLRVLGFKADLRGDHLRVFGQELRYIDDLWVYGADTGARKCARAIVEAGDAPAPQRDDDAPSCACWQDGTRLTKRELRAWLRA